MGRGEMEVLISGFAEFGMWKLKQVYVLEKNSKPRRKKMI